MRCPGNSHITSFRKSLSMFLLHPSVKSILRGMVLWAPLWIATTLGCGLLGAVYAFFLKQDVYLASQALLVRDEANATMMRLGRFESQTQMKAAQETIMEMAKNRQVVRDALSEVGPESRGWSPWALLGSLMTPAKFPSDQEVETFALSNISVHAPKGVEFGNTEVIYLDVKGSSQERALALVKAVSNSLDLRLRQVRQTRAESVIHELQTAKSAAQKELAETSNRIQQMERDAGALLPDLRGMTDAVSSGTSRSQIDQIMNELRTAQSQLEQSLADQKLLEEALANPTAYVVAPGSLLNAQPGLKKLREGLADAQLSMSQLKGKFTDSHPLVEASRDAQTTIEQQLTSALEASKTTLSQDIATSQKRIEQLNQQKQMAEGRLDSLAGIRTQYANLASELKTRSTILEETERQLAEATASREASQTVSLLSLLDAPQVGDNPIGPGRAVLTILCSVGGMLLGMGFVLAVTPIDGATRFGRRWADQMSLDQREPNNESSRTAQQPHVPTREVASQPMAMKEPPQLTTAEQALQRRLQADRSLAHDSKSHPKTNTNKNSIAFEHLMADEKDYASTNRPSEPVDVESETILERLAKVQESFEDKQREMDVESKNSTESRSPAKDEASGNERRTRPRPTETVASTIAVSIRPRK
jgi:uncharacterized protein involved in exopolysaccharide biosynthesis